MADCYGVFLLAAIGCIVYCVSLWLPLKVKNQIGRNVIYWCLAIGIWVFDNAYRHLYSKEAIAYKNLEEIVELWGDGFIGKKKACQRLQDWSSGAVPWKISDDESESEIGLY